MREAGKKQLIIGLVIAVVGVVISLGSYVSAASSSGGGSYFLLWGIVIVGLVRAFRGFSMMRSAGPAQTATASPAVAPPAAVPAMPPQPPAETAAAQAVEATTPEPVSLASPPPPPAPSSMWD